MFGRKNKSVSLQENGDIKTSLSANNLDPNLGHTIQTIRTLPAQNTGRVTIRGLLLFIMSLTCCIILLMPYECGQTALPSFLKVPNYQKMMASYLMGILTMGVIVGRN